MFTEERKALGNPLVSVLWQSFAKVKQGIGHPNPTPACLCSAASTRPVTRQSHSDLASLLGIFWDLLSPLRNGWGAGVYKRWISRFCLTIPYPAFR